MSKNKNPTFVTTARFDLRIAAQLLLFWESQNITITSRAQLIEQTLYGFADMILAKDGASEITSTEYALRILTERGLINQKPIRNQKTLLKALSLEDIEQEQKGKTKTVLSDSEEKKAEKILMELENVTL